MRKWWVGCAAALAWLCSGTSFAQIEVMVPSTSDVISERLSAREAASAKALADSVSPRPDAANLLRFYSNLQRLKFGRVVEQAPIPAHKLESSYLQSLSLALTSRPYIWLPDRTLARGEYASAVPLIGYQVVGGARQATGQCSGSLIARYAVLTAAHCACELGPNVMAYLGTENYHKDIGVRVDVVATKSRISSCEAYKAADVHGKRDIMRAAGDVAVMFLSEDAGKINVPLAVLTDSFKPSESYYIVGYGISDTDARPGVRRIATIQGMSCTHADSGKYGCNPAYEFWGDGRQITGRTDRPDSCGGDSGGSVFTTDKQAQPRLIGVISRPVTGTTCGQGGVYVLLTPPILGWVEELRKLASSSSPPA